MFLADLYRQVRWFVRARALAARGVEFGTGLRAASDVRARPGFAQGKKGQIVAGSGNRWEDGVILYAYGGTIRLGANVHLGPYTVIYGHGDVTLGDNCLVAPHCSILSSNHAVPALGTAIRSQPDVLLPTKIGHDVWLGAGATVLGGVTIGDGCVVGAGAVVTEDLPAGSVAVGVPARVTRQRT